MRRWWCLCCCLQDNVSFVFVLLCLCDFTLTQFYAREYEWVGNLNDEKSYSVPQIWGLTEWFWVLDTESEILGHLGDFAHSQMRPAISQSQRFVTGNCLWFFLQKIREHSCFVFFPESQHIDSYWTDWRFSTLNLYCEIGDRISGRC